MYSLTATVYAQMATLPVETIPSMPQPQRCVCPLKWMGHPNHAVVTVCAAAKCRETSMKKKGICTKNVVFRNMIQSPGGSIFLFISKKEIKVVFLFLFFF